MAAAEGAARPRGVGIMSYNCEVGATPWARVIYIMEYCFVMRALLNSASTRMSLMLLITPAIYSYLPPRSTGPGHLVHWKGKTH